MLTKRMIQIFYIYKIVKKYLKKKAKIKKLIAVIVTLYNIGEYIVGYLGIKTLSIITIIITLSLIQIYFKIKKMVY